jgi:hypothetical protein
MRSVRFFYEEDMNINIRCYILTFLYSKYIKYVEYMKRIN